MRTRSETILLLEPCPYVESRYAGALTKLGYWQLLYANYVDTPAFAIGTAMADGVVAIWLDPKIAVDRVARAVANATGFPRVRGALVVSPFTTASNARLLAQSGAKGWARPPLSESDFAGRLGCLLHGDRRLGADRRTIADRRTAPDRRRQPLYPLAVPA